jgi:hypothetical protein
MFKLSHGRSDALLTAEEVAKAIYNGTVETGGFICGRMAYMSQFREAIKFTSEEDLVEALKQYVNDHDTQKFDYNKVVVIFQGLTGAGTSALFKVEFEIPKIHSGIVSDISRKTTIASPKELEVFKRLHTHNKEDIVTKKTATVHLVGISQ